jgi:23S rRNA pseudouridine1911/1915/1917 synthase
VYGPDALRPVDFPRQALHAFQLVFRHPSDNRRIEFEAPLPRDMADLVTRLRST